MFIIKTSFRAIPMVMPHLNGLLLLMKLLLTFVWPLRYRNWPMTKRIELWS